MNIKIKGIKARVDKDKAVVELEHSFHPLKDDDSVEVICEYFKTGERDSLAELDGDELPVLPEQGAKKAPDPKTEGEDAQLAQLIAGFSRLSPQQKSAVLAVIEGYQPSQE